MELTGNRTEITLRLLTSGRYTWTITINTSSDETDQAIAQLQSINSKLEDTFPNHVSIGTGRAQNLNEE